MATVAYARSEASLKAYLEELNLGSLFKKFEENGWASFNDLSFSTPDPAKRVEQFEDQVVPLLVDVKTPAGKKLIPRLRQLHAKAYSVASAALAEPPATAEQRISMPPADRQAKLAELKTKINGFELLGMNAPSNALIDRMSTILQKSHVKYVEWQRCTSMEQEMLDEVEVKALRLSPEGFLLRDVAPETTTDISGELLFDFALRRRALAAYVAGLCSFRTMDQWHELLKAYLLKEPPAGWRRVGWAQLRNADVALWHAVAVKCTEGVAKKGADNLTAFETAFKNSQHDADVRVPLMFLPSGSGGSGGAASSSSGSGKGGLQLALPKQQQQSDSGKEMQKLKNRMAEMQKQLSATKRKATEQATKGNGKSRKGSGKAPKGWGNDPTAAPNNQRICFAYNLGGCRQAADGQQCPKGLHVCPICIYANPTDAAHPKSKCPAKG